MITLIAWWVAIFIVGLLIGSLIHDASKSKKIKDLEHHVEVSDSKFITTNAELEWQKLARKIQQKKYDELYTRMLAVNAQNAKLTKENQELMKSTFNELHPIEPKVQIAVDETVKAQLLSHSFSREMWSAVYNLFLRGATRMQIAKRYGVSYANVCKIIREKDRKQDPLF